MALGVGAAWTVLPLTTRNVADLAWRFEQRVPAVAEAHLRVRQETERAVRMVRVHGEQGIRLVQEKIADAREAVEGWVRKGR